VEEAPDAPIHEVGQRVLLFEVVQDLLLLLARRARVGRCRVSVGRERGMHRVEIVPVGPPADMDGDAGPARGHRGAADVLAHLRERMAQVNGRLELEPDAQRVERIVITATVED
jgi:solute:Na+ symporter, SSS family